MHEISNMDDLIDSRDVIARLRELEDSREGAKLPDATEEPDDGWTAEDGTIFADSWLEDDEREYQALRALSEEASGCSDWRYGATLIRDGYFEDYAREFAEDIGAVKRELDWPCNFIDWEAAADALKSDYSAVDFDGERYWIGAY